MLFLLVTILVGLLLFFRLWLDGSALARLVLPRVESAIGRRITYESVSLTWLSASAGRISLTDVKISGTSKSPPILYVPSIDLEIDLSSATKGSVTIRSARFTKPVLTFKPEIQTAREISDREITDQCFHSQPSPRRESRGFRRSCGVRSVSE